MKFFFLFSTVFADQCPLPDFFEEVTNVIPLIAERPGIIWPTVGCHFLEQFYGTRTQGEKLRPEPIPALLTNFFALSANSLVPEIVPIPCKPCDAERKDRSFIRGTAYTSQSSRLLVDHASAAAGAKIVAFPPGLRGVADILVSDNNRYLLTLCSSVWFTIRLAEEVFVDKIGLIASELFASTFRHIQILGARQFPTSEWRILGEIETNPMENQEWFDVGASSECAKCYVKYIKVRVLTHHALEGYTNCALTQFQVFGSTVLQSLNKLQQETTTDLTGSRLPSFVRTSLHTLSELMEERISQLEGTVYVRPVPLPETATPSSAAELQPAAEVVAESDEKNPLLKFVEEMTLLKKQYSAVASNLNLMNEQLLKSSVTPVQANGTATETKAAMQQSDGGVWNVAILGFQFPVTLNNFLIALLTSVQIWTLVLVYSGKLRANNNQTRQEIVRINPVVHNSRNKKRSHGIGKPRIRRSIFSLKHQELKHEFQILHALLDSSKVMPEVKMEPPDESFDETTVLIPKETENGFISENNASVAETLTNQIE